MMARLDASIGLGDGAWDRLANAGLKRALLNRDGSISEDPFWMRGAPAAVHRESVFV